MLDSYEWVAVTALAVLGEVSQLIFCAAVWSIVFESD